MNPMSEDSKAILLLCGRFGNHSEAEPLQQREYAALVDWLRGQELRPADLLRPETVSRAAEESGFPEGRLNALLTRGVQLGFAVEKWQQSGLWVVSRSDSDYPRRLKDHLGEKAPPMLYGAGDRTLLAGGGLAIVGSRNADEAALGFTREVAQWCARGGMPVVSGGARGVDRIAMGACLEAGGIVVGVLADSLLKRSVARDARPALADGRLLLLSPYHPEARFTVGTAMGRNKLIYAMADYGLVVSAEQGRGGTWEGATEELKRRPRRPVFVRLSDPALLGNTALVERGAQVFPAWDPEDLPQALLARQADDQPHVQKQGLLDLEDPGQPERVAEPPPAAPTASVYDAVLPLILAALAEPLAPDELATRLDVGKGQLRIWLNRAIDEQRVRKLTRPVRYVRQLSGLGS